jgi:N-acetylglutamate synthase-like GNAT family acetyltransferase
MSSLKFQARRATLDDLPRLKELWAVMRISDADLERQLTDFQVAVDETGQVVGGMAFQMSQRHACIHSEAFEDFSLAEYARPVLLDRIQTLATNHGLVRVWTREQSPFWTRNGFQPATEAVLEKMPSIWDRSSTGWLTLKLKEEEVVASLDKEFALFVETEKQQRHQLLNQAKVFKTVALTIITLIALGIGAAALWIFLKQRGGGGLLPPP